MSCLSELPAYVASLDGPDWLAERRAAAVGRAAEAALPDPSAEVWRYSRIAELDLDRWRLAASPSGEMPTRVAELLDQLGPRAALAVVVDGWLTHVELSDAAASAGLRLASSTDLPEVEGGQSGQADLFGALNLAAAPTPLVLDVPAGVTLSDPVVVIEWVTQPDALALPRFEVLVGADADLQVLEWQGADEVAAMVAPVTTVTLGRAARLGFETVQVLGSDVWQVAEFAAEVGADATLVAAHVGLGGDYARARTDCRLVGQGGSATMLAAYFGEGSQTLDYRTFQLHDAPDTTSSLLYKGVVADESRSVYSGMIRVDKGARGSNAFQTNRNIKLSDGAWAESVPNLEIENNDVRCSHASTVGPIDEDQRFYLESRGVPQAVAERLIIAGFFEEVCEQLPVAATAPLVADAISRRLARRVDIQSFEGATL